MIINSHKQALGILEKHKVNMPFSKEGMEAAQSALVESAKAELTKIESEAKEKPADTEKVEGKNKVEGKS